MTTQTNTGNQRTKNTKVVVIGGASYSIHRPKQWTLVSLAGTAGELQGDPDSIDIANLSEMIETLMALFRTDDATKTKPSSRARITEVLNDLDSDIDLEDVVNKVLQSVDDAAGKGGR